MSFGTDRVMLYNVQPWSDLGFGSPNFGENVGTVNNAVARLVDEVGKTQLFIMMGTDAMRWKAPSRNTIERLAKLLMRVQTILSGRARKNSDLLLEAGHATPDQNIFMIHPCPYFPSEVLRNPWLKEYNNLVMIALANMMQHSDNNLPLNVTEAFAKDVWQWFREIKILLGTELLLLPRSEVEKDEFVFTDAHFSAYDSSKVIINMEAADTPSNIFGLYTEDDLRPLLVGIPANQIAPLLTQAPIGPLGPFAGQNPAGGFSSGVSGSQTNVAAAPTAGGGAIGTPSI